MCSSDLVRSILLRSAIFFFHVTGLKSISLIGFVTTFDIFVLCKVSVCLLKSVLHYQTGVVFAQIDWCCKL